MTFAKENDEFLEVVRTIPLERMMVETDCPFLTPVPHRGKRNEPQFTRFVIQKIAEIKNLPPQKIETQTDQTAINFFRLKIL